MYVPANAKTNDIKAFCIGNAFGINIIATTIPSCAESIVAPVVGDTNLFLLICCIISPHILIPIPASIIAISLGNLLINIMFILSLLKLRISETVIFLAPINKEIKDNIINIIVKYLFFILFSHLL